MHGRLIAALVLATLAGGGVGALAGASAEPARSAATARHVSHAARCRRHNRRERRWRARHCHHHGTSTHSLPAGGAGGSSGGAGGGASGSSGSSGGSTGSSGSGSGSGSGAGETTSTGATPPPVVPRVQVTAVEYSFTLSRTTVPAGKVILEFVNHGQDEHNLNAQLGEAPPAGSIGNTESGHVVDQAVELRPGSYTLFCSLAEHEKKGMKATLTVE